jgi:hypothetical protein
MEGAKVSNVKVNEQSMMAHNVVDTIHFFCPLNHNLWASLFRACIYDMNPINKFNTTLELWHMPTIHYAKTWLASMTNPKRFHDYILCK